MLFIIIHNSIYNMLFNYTHCVLHSLRYFTPGLSLLSPPITVSALSPSPSWSLSRFLSRSLCSAERSREKPREIGRGRKQREIGRERDPGKTLEKEREERDRGRESLHVLENGEPPLEDDANKNHHDGEPPEIVLLLLSVRERSSFFSASSEETTMRLQRGRASERFGKIFCYRLKEYRGL